jgi:hypothetical protein
MILWALGGYHDMTETMYLPCYISIGTREPHCVVCPRNGPRVCSAAVDILQRRARKLSRVKSRG